MKNNESIQETFEKAGVDITPKGNKFRKKIENITDACRALAEKYPDRYGISKSENGQVTFVFKSLKTISHERYILNCGYLISDLYACDFDSILELVGLRVLLSLGTAPNTNLHKTLWCRLYETDWSFIDNYCTYTLIVKEANEAAFIAAVEWLVKEKE